MPSSVAWSLVGFALRVSQSFEESLLRWPAAEAELEAVPDEPAPAWWSVAIASTDFSKLAGITYGLGPAPPAVFAASLARANGLGALLPPNADMSPSCTSPRSALIESPVKLIGSVIVVLDSKRSRRSTFLASRRRRCSVKLRCRRKRPMGALPETGAGALPCAVLPAVEAGT